MVFVRCNFFIWFWAFWPFHEWKFPRNGANAFAFHCFGICLFAKRNDHRMERRNWRGKNRTTERVSKIFKCTNNVFVNDSSEFAISCVTVVYCKYGKSSWATPFLYHSMCFVHWFVLSCLYTKITINTYIVCYIQFVCSRLIRFLCTCLFISVIFFSELVTFNGMYNTIMYVRIVRMDVWMYVCAFVQGIYL